MTPKEYSLSIPWLWLWPSPRVSVSGPQPGYFSGRCDPKRRRTKWGRRGKSLGRGGGRVLVVWDRIARQVYSWGGGGGVDFECVNVSHLGASWGMLPRKILILSPPKWLEMHLKLTWWGETYILSTDKKSRHKNIFSTKSCVALIGLLISFKQHKELGPACQSWRKCSYPPTVKITIQIQYFAETYGKQTLKGILLSNEKMSCRHTRSPFNTLRTLKDVLWKGWVTLVISFTGFFYTISE